MLHSSLYRWHKRTGQVTNTNKTKASFPLGQYGAGWFWRVSPKRKVKSLWEERSSQLIGLDIGLSIDNPQLREDMKLK